MASEELPITTKWPSRFMPEPLRLTMRCRLRLTIGAITAVSEVANTATPSTMTDTANNLASGVTGTMSP